MEDSPEQSTGNDVEREALEHLFRIEGELEAIKERTPGPSHVFINGIWQGAGAVAGGIIALLLLGWVLFIFGLIPGFGFITSHLKDAVQELHGH